MNTKLLNKLQQGGLTQREAHIYLALLQKKEFYASEIASIIPVGRTKIYEVIPNLIAKGLCSEVFRDGKKIYRAVEPRIAFKNLLHLYHMEMEEIIQQSEEKLADKKVIIGQLEEELDEIYTNNIKKSDNLDYIEMLKDRNKTKERWIELQKNTRMEMLGFNKPPYSMPPRESMKHQQKMMKRKNVINKGIYEFDEVFSGSSDTELYNVVDFFSKLGEECRIIKRLPMKMIIIDEKITMLALKDPVSMKLSTTTMIIEHPDFALAQKQVFESYWNKATPFEEFSERFLPKKNK